MHPIHLLLTIRSVNDHHISLAIADASDRIGVVFDQEKNHFSFEGPDHLQELLTRNQFQLKKVITSALKGNVAFGQPISCVFIENFPFIQSHDYEHFIRIDRRKPEPVIDVSPEGIAGIPSLYTDGSYAREVNRSGYAGLIEDANGMREVFHDTYSGGSSGLMELMAVAEGLKRLGPAEKIRVHTDSRFVIRGLAQWIWFWKANNWQMAYSRKVRYASHWQELDRLSERKLLELKWIKGHSGDTRQELCHRMAKEAATLGYAVWSVSK